MKAINWSNGIVIVLDERVLPMREVYHICREYAEVVEAIRSGAIRNSSILRIATAMGIALGTQRSLAETPDQFDKELDAICAALMNAGGGNENVARVAAQFKAAYLKYRKGGMLVVRIAMVMEALILQTEESAETKSSLTLPAAENRPDVAPAGNLLDGSPIHPWV